MLYYLRRKRIAIQIEHEIDDDTPNTTEANREHALRDDDDGGDGQRQKGRP